ncbi:hypothetical protein LCGC14_2483230 [marine sediment metagenome]|uniref:Uncharacterized protein n=1 Tax=marine sediment metagenome TaxID=412755 RepID=A0A0F9DIW6_9ZZZZ
MSYFICPYCDEELEEPEECNDTMENYEWECEHCAKNFIFTVEYDRMYTEQKADCLNGKPHEWESVMGLPKEAFKDSYQCIMCGKRERRKCGQVVK